MRHRFHTLAQAFALVSAVSPLRLHAQAHEGAHWAYKGKEGPSHWGALDSAYALCARGKAQSPINIVPTAPHQLPGLSIAYQPTAINILNNGHTIQVTYDSGSFILVEQTRYQLLQFHFHEPSEHTINGKGAPAELHLVHRSADGHLAVIGVLLQTGPANPAFATLWAHLPAAEGPAQRIDAQVNAADLIPARHGTYRYDGSLTTPPCSESVKWLVMASPVMLSEEQITALKAALPPDNRPVQPLNHRKVADDVRPGQE
jgi:carbonic anhydrase